MARAGCTACCGGIVRSLLAQIWNPTVSCPGLLYYDIGLSDILDVGYTGGYMG